MSIPDPTDRAAVDTFRSYRADSASSLHRYGIPPHAERALRAGGTTQGDEAARLYRALDGLEARCVELEAECIGLRVMLAERGA